MRRALAGAALLAVAAVADASSIGTPQANRPPSGTPRSLAIGHHHNRGAAAAGGSTVATPRMTQAEWRRAYIARHHHDLPQLSHPGR